MGKISKEKGLLDLAKGTGDFDNALEEKQGAFNLQLKRVQ